MLHSLCKKKSKNLMVTGNSKVSVVSIILLLVRWYVLKCTVFTDIFFYVASELKMIFYLVI